jgi:uncharacterized protein YggE
MKKMLLVISVFFFCHALSAQDNVRKISVTGKSTITLDAQYSKISIRVKETDKTMASSHMKLNDTFDQLAKALIDLGIAEDNIKKSIIDQGAEYKWQNNERIFTGYFSSCDIIFNVNDLTTLPAVYQTLANYEQINILGSEYKRNDDFEKRKIEFKKALVAAKEKAAYMAALMDCKLGKVKEITEISSQNYFTENVYSNTMRSEQTPDISFGSVTITAAVHVEFYLE